MKPSSWIYRVGLNTCISFYRQQQRRGEHTSLDSLYGLEAEDSETTKRLKEMYRLIAGLDKFERAVILLWLDENSYEEIAEIVGVPRNTVASRLKRIRINLQNKRIAKIKQIMELEELKQNWNIMEERLGRLEMDQRQPQLNNKVVSKVKKVRIVCCVDLRL